MALCPLDLCNLPTTSPCFMNNKEWAENHRHVCQCTIHDVRCNTRKVICCITLPLPATWNVRYQWQRRSTATVGDYSLVTSVSFITKTIHFAWHCSCCWWWCRHLGVIGICVWSVVDDGADTWELLASVYDQLLMMLQTPGSYWHLCMISCWWWCRHLGVIGIGVWSVVDDDQRCFWDVIKGGPRALPNEDKGPQAPTPSMKKAASQSYRINKGKHLCICMLACWRSCSPCHSFVNYGHTQILHAH